MKQPERYLITMISLLLFVVAAVFVEVTIGEEVKHQYRGLSPEVQKKLATATTLACDKGTKSFPVSVINDNYCDCEDGSDEPGTSACSHTKRQFYCINQGFFSKQIPTSRVNDQLCDCCDGSDEYASGIQCENTCGKLMQVYIQEKGAEIEIFQAGILIHEEILKNSTQLFQQDQQKLEQLQENLEKQKKIVLQSTTIKEKEELQEKSEQLQMSKSTRLEIAQSLGLDQLNFEQLSLIIVDLSTQLYQKDDVLKAIRVQLDASHLGASPIEKEEEAFKIRDAERQKETERIEKLMEEKRKAKEAAEAAAKTQAEAEGVTYTPPPTVETTDEIELKVPEVETRPVILLFDKVSASQTHRREEAEQARTALREAENLQKEQEKQVSSLQEALSKSYGNENVLYSLRDRCVESRSGQYVYSMCYYGHAKQDSISLGMMEPPVFPEGDEDKITLKFTKGTKCWNGPERSLSVTFQCGAQEELYQIEEPETCVYKALLKTPLGCSKKILSAMTSEVEVSATL